MIPDLCALHLKQILQIFSCHFFLRYMLGHVLVATYMAVDIGSLITQYASQAQVESLYLMIKSLNHYIIISQV